MVGEGGLSDAQLIEVIGWAAEAVEVRCLFRRRGAKASGEAQ